MHLSSSGHTNQTYDHLSGDTEGLSKQQKSEDYSLKHFGEKMIFIYAI